jgi:hypothetical protein
MPWPGEQDLRISDTAFVICSVYLWYYLINYYCQHFDTCIELGFLHTSTVMPSSRHCWYGRGRSAGGFPSRSSRARGGVGTASVAAELFSSCFYTFWTLSSSVVIMLALFKFLHF